VTSTAGTRRGASSVSSAAAAIVTAASADVSVVTSDNPRGEDPAAIAETVLEGIDAAGGRRVLELDRGRAIERALGMARRGDVVLIAGKGHENTQTIAGRALPFDDRVVAVEALARLAAEGGGSTS